MEMVDLESTKLTTKTPKLAITSLLSKIFVFERKWGFDKMGTFGQNPCLFGENGYPFYQEHTVEPVPRPGFIPLIGIAGSQTVIDRSFDSKTVIDCDRS